MLDNEIADLAMKTLRIIFEKENPSIPYPIGCMHSSWKKDKFAGGSWSCFPCNRRLQSKSETDMEDEPLCYAGEAAYGNFRGTVHGAYLSGVSEANRILQRQ
jgi:monoamine oxidase